MSATEFLNNERFHTSFQTSLLLKAYQSACLVLTKQWGVYATRATKQLLTCNTSSSKGNSRCFITNSVMTGKKQRNKTINTKKTTFFNLALTLLNYELFATMCINLWKTVCSEKNIYFLHACFFKCWKRLLIKRLLVKNKKKLLSIMHRLRIKQIYGDDFSF